MRESRFVNEMAFEYIYIYIYIYIYVCIFLFFLQQGGEAFDSAGFDGYFPKAESGAERGLQEEEVFAP